MVRVLALSLPLLLAGIPAAQAESTTTVTLAAQSAKVVTELDGESPVALDGFVDHWLASLSKSGIVRLPVLTKRGQKTENEFFSTKEVTTKRHLFAELFVRERRLPVMFEVKEEVSTCLPGKTCTPKVTLTLTGPLVSYESATPHQSLESLFGGRQRIVVKFEKDPGTTVSGVALTDPKTKITSEFKVLSMQFERSVMEFLKSRYPGALREFDGAVDQHLVLGGAARILATVNKGALR